MKKLLTLCIVHQDPRVLLGMKKRGFGAGRWNGFGGKLEPGESIEAAARREMQEESGVELIDMEKFGIVEFEFVGNPEILEVHIFKANNFLGELVESEEMRPQWFHVDEIPFADMWPDDKYWLPLILAGKKFTGKLLFADQDTVISQEFLEVEEI